MDPILYTLFEDNPELPREAAKFCRTVPGYQQAEADFFRLAEEVRRLLGTDFYLAFEQAMNAHQAFERAMNAHQAYEVRAHYLFGLGLRREVLDALGRADD